jgi:phosphoglycolate phosphatase-like HAD superfamily hydrolase
MINDNNSMASPLNAFVHLIENEINGLLVFTDVEEELKALNALGYRLGLVTNCWPFPLRPLLGHRALSGAFEHVISSHFEQVAKQQGPTIYQVAAARFGVRTDQCLMVGDNPALDVIPPQAAGMHTMLLDRDGSYVDREGKFINPLYREQLRVTIIRNLRELTDLARAGKLPAGVEVILFDLWKTLARGPYPEPINFLKDMLGLEGRVSDEEFLVVCLTTSPEDPAEYLHQVAHRYGIVTLPGGEAI